MVLAVTDPDSPEAVNGDRIKVKLYKHQNNNIVLIKVLENKIDSALAPEFKKELLATVFQETPNMIIDLVNVDYMDSSGLGSLLFGHRQAGRNNGTMVLIKPRHRVKKLIDIAQLTRVLQICDSEEDAIKLIQGELDGCSKKTDG